MLQLPKAEDFVIATGVQHSVREFIGDARKARSKLGWEPKIGFKALVSEMVQSDLRAAERNDLARRHGHRVFEGRE